MKSFFFTLIVFINTLIFSQHTTKEVKALKIDKAPTIDGVLDEDFWQDTDIAKDFVMYEPEDGGPPERENKKTTVKIAYDNEAIYFGVTLYDDTPDKIPKQFTLRDKIGITDFFIISLNPNNDGQNDTEFMVMSTGVQVDAKVNPGGREDYTWSAVWYSKVKFNDNGWVIELKIPFYSLRFSTHVDTWGLNFHRKINYLNEQYSWNYIDRKIGVYTQHSGLLTGMKGIKPPVRLSFSPYASAAYTTDGENSAFVKNIGLDLKYGISENFTLDATLIPDFQQAAFDDLILNLSPFEQRFDEQRAFFTEGTELFNKGRLFYSRRIGNRPVGYRNVKRNLADNEEIIENPSKVNMLNAVKVSGRTKKGLGIGFFNAITEKTFATIKATIEDPNTGETTEEIRKETTEPLANYNVLVVDQQFNKNSSISLTNTNVTRNGSFRDANVTALAYDVSDKKNKYNARGSLKISNIKENRATTDGYSGYLRLSKIFGNFQYSIAHLRNNDTYYINDFGFKRRNNQLNYFGDISYQIFKPTKHFNKYKISLFSKIEYLNSGNEYLGNELELDAFFITKKIFAFGGGIETNFGNQYDYFEPRVAGRFFTQKGVFEGSAWISTDYRKKFAMDVRTIAGKRAKSNENYVYLNISPRYQFTDKFQLIYDFEYTKINNEKGRVTRLDTDAIIFGNRDVKTYVNSLSGKLNFNIKSSLSLSFRHYWSPVQYDTNFFELNSQGRLDNHSYTGNHDINYNIWNLDLNFMWEFAPGSQFIALYRNVIFNKDDLSHLSFSKNLDNLFQESATNNFSIKLIYFLDYNKIRNWF